MNNYKSNFERYIAECLEEAEIDFTYESYTYTFEVPEPGKLSCGSCGSRDILRTKSYTPDFFLKNGIIIETKGKCLTKHRREFEAFKDAFPDEDFRILFIRNNLLRKKGLYRYGDWAEKVGIPYAIGELPQEWIKECIEEK